jgi:hypothetical protein
MPASRARGKRSAEWEGWQPGGPWLPLGGRLSAESLTSPSGRFTLLHSAGAPSLAVRVVQGTWPELQRRRDAAYPDGGHVVAAVAVGPDVLVVSDDPALPAATLSPGTSVAALRQPPMGYPAFSLHQDGRLVAERREDPRRRKGLDAAEVAAAVNEIVGYFDGLELVFRTSQVVPSAAALGGVLLGGTLAPARSASVPSAPPAAGPLSAIEGYDSMEPLVVRTDFTDEAAWIRVVRRLRKPWVDDRPVNPCLVSDLGYADAPAGRVLQDVRTALTGPARPEAVFIADSTTMRETGHPLLAVSTKWDGKPFDDDEEEFVTQFRVLPDAVIEVTANLGIANAGFEDFAGLT